MEKKITCPLTGWEIVREINSGSYGKVYEIKKLDEFGEIEHSALKVISVPESSSEVNSYRDDGLDDESIMEFLTNRVKEIREEFSFMSKLRGNSNIVSYEDHETIQHEDGLGYDILIRMELLTSLTDYYTKNIDAKKINDDIVIQLGIDICRALELCRKHSIIHRDIKPQNIFINKNGDFKLGDFGIAKTMDHSTYATKAGTYGYMAPEIYKAQLYNASVDMYSLGMVMYWMLNERRGPFLPLPPETPRPSQNKDAFDRRMSGEDFPRPLHGSRELADVVLKACAFDSKDRFSNPTEMRLALEGIDKTVYVPSDEESDKTVHIPACVNADLAEGKQDEKDSEPQPDKLHVIKELSNSLNKKRLIITGSVAAAILLVVVLIVASGRGQHSQDTEAGATNDSISSTTPLPSDDVSVPPPEEKVNWDSSFPVDAYLEGGKIEMIRQYRSAELEVANEEKNDGSPLCYVEKKIVQDWSDWQEEEPESSDMIEIETRTIYKYRTLHGVRVNNNTHSATWTEYRWSKWEYSTEPVNEKKGSTEVEEVTQYRYRVCEYDYYYAIGDWNDFGEERIAPDDTHIVNMSMLYRAAESDKTQVSSIDNFDLVSLQDIELTDVFPERWYYSCVNSVVETGIMYEDEFLRFLPDKSVTVEEIVRAAVAVNRIYKGECGILPLDEDLYYLVENDAMDRGIIQPGEFPNMGADITRLEAATIIYRALPVKELVAVNEIADITDMDKASDAYRAVYQLAKAGIVTFPSPTGTFSPEKNISRAEAASMFDRLIHPDRRYVR